MKKRNREKRRRRRKKKPIQERNKDICMNEGRYIGTRKKTTHVQVSVK